jgi:hypothetical protein
VSVRLVQTHDIALEDEQFFRALAEGLRPFWVTAKSLGFTEADFNTQELPDGDRVVANSGFRLLSQLPSVASALEGFSKEKGFKSNRNAMVYNPMSLMRWHTNSNAPGLRHYFTYTTGRAIFRWRHPETGEVFDEIDKIGWTHRTFFINPSQLLWHTIWTEKVRLSFGFNSEVPQP